MRRLVAGWRIYNDGSESWSNGNASYSSGPTTFRSTDGTTGHSVSIVADGEDARAGRAGAQRGRVLTVSYHPVFPLIYHDIKAEIPPGDLQVATTHIYYLWLILVATLIINLVACVFIGVKELISAIVYLVVITPASFMLWYRPVYNGFMKEHSLFYYMYFVFCGFHLAWSIYVFLGIPETGSAALLSTIESFTAENKRIVAGALGIVTTVGFAVQGLGNLWYYKQIWKHNHDQGHTFAQARAELASHGAKAYFTRGSNV